MSMSKVSSCEVSECVYNRDKKCHTLAITVGNTTSPSCDTYMKHEKKGGDSDTIGGVGACKTEICQFNKNFECRAESIIVGKQNNNPECKTFKK
ncbi:MAG: DUF1540 domain-containing protein [Oligoflexia bacterium]|nr:DUF1540 domain-containing protein [Oligoflexia bacterium]